MSNKNIPEISIVLATYKRQNLLDMVLRSLAAQTLPKHLWEVVICVDDLSDPSIEFLRKWAEVAEYKITVLTQANSGQSIARHRAIQKAQGLYIIVIDDDMELSPRFVEEHLLALKQNPEKVVVIGKVIPLKNWKEEPLYEAIRTQHMIEFHERLSVGQIPSASAFVTQNVSFPRKLYDLAGGFDSQLRLDEDRELGIRLERVGAQFVFCSEASAIHHSQIGNYRKWFMRQYEYGKYAVLVWQKHGKDPYLHPLRNLVTGSRLNAAVVHLFGPFDFLSKIVTTKLKILGILLKRFGFIELGLATHKAILAIQYHRGARDQLGSWKALVEEKRTFEGIQDRPREPTGKGPTIKTRA